MEYDAKKTLKDAKEAVKNKEFEAALELCKVILKHAKSNYLAWVLSAVSFQELGHGDKALSAFTRATELQPAQLTAWQGLAAFLEQDRARGVVNTDKGEKSRETLERLVGVYKKLEELLTGDATKLVTIWKKQCELFASADLLEDCGAKARVLLQKDDDGVTKHVIKILWPLQEKLGSDGMQLLEQALERVTRQSEDQTDPTETDLWDGQYLQVLLRLKDYEKALLVARRLLSRRPDSVQSLEALCLVSVEDESSAVTDEEVRRAVDGLPPTLTALKAKAGLLLKTGGPLEAKQLLEAIRVRDPSPSTLRLLCHAYQALHQWHRAEKVCQQQQQQQQQQQLTAAEDYRWLLRSAKNLIEQGGVDQLREAGRLLDALRPQREGDCASFQTLQALYYAKMGDADGLGRVLDALEPSVPVVLSLRSRLLEMTGRVDEAVDLLEQSLVGRPASDVDVELSLARLLWNAGRRQESVGHLLNVIKINRDLAEPYVLLGAFYGAQEDGGLQRAVRCLEKAFHLEPERPGTDRQLLELYRRAGDTAAGLKLLDVVIKTGGGDGGGSSSWAWAEKGRWHLKSLHDPAKNVLDAEKEATLAIGCLQNALRSDSSDSRCWETLGDAYIARGSYTAALKAFNKATELDAGSIYCVYQTASIKQKLGEHVEAVETYERLLEGAADYVPALKGLAETLLDQAVEFEADGFTGRLADGCRRALRLLVRAARLRPHSSCLWSLMGRVCLLLRCLAESTFEFSVPAVLLLADGGGESAAEDRLVAVTKRQVMELGLRFYSTALRLTADSAPLWYNLALCYHSCSRLADDGGAAGGERVEAERRWALAAVKKAVALQPTEASYWNLLGLVAPRPAVAQHAFIRAVELQPASAEAWTNLGAVYYECGDRRLAHQCFARAQNADPFYVPAWIGQANIAQQLSPAEAMDLFRHTVAIGSGRPTECEGALSYAHWVLDTLADPQGRDRAHYRYSILEMHAVPVACDGLQRYCNLYPQDSCALNVLGLLFERQGLLERAEEVLERGVAVLKDDGGPAAAETTAASAASAGKRGRSDKIKANLARVYTSRGRCDDATELYASLHESELTSACGIALAHFRAGRFLESYVTYEAALHWLASDDALRSHLLVAMAMAAFRRDLSDPEAAQTLLFQSCQLQPPSVYGLLALGALGLLTEDDTLTDAAFQEMLPYELEPRYGADVVFQRAFRCWSAGDGVRRAGRELCRHIHVMPQAARPWAQLAALHAAGAVHQGVHRGGAPAAPTAADGLLVARCARIALEARRRHDTAAAGADDADQHGNQVELSEVMSLIGIGYLSAGERRAGLTAAQKAVHCSPHSAASWSVLLAAAAASWTAADDADAGRLLWLKRLIGHLRRHCDVATFSGLAPWLGGYERRLTGLLSQRNQ